jgi:hypothetical protein
MAMVQVTVATDLADAEEIQTILTTAGIESELHPAVDQHPRALGNEPTQILVAEEDLEAAQDAIEALTEPEDLIGEA